MPAYPIKRPQSNPTPLAHLVPAALRAPAEAPATPARDEFGLTPPPRRTKKDLPTWITRALAAVKPRQRSLRQRIGRMRKNNPKHSSGRHVAEREKREARLKCNLPRFAAYQVALLKARLPGRLHASARSLVEQGCRLRSDEGWCGSWSYIAKRTGKPTETIYLPEDTWSAETAFDYIVSFLARLVASVRGMTEKTTPRYKPGSTERPLREARSAQGRVWTPADAAALLLRRAGPQAELPATS